MAVSADPAGGAERRRGRREKALGRGGLGARFMSPMNESLMRWRFWRTGPRLALLQDLAPQRSCEAGTLLARLYELRGFTR
jgi:hypothetical protein